jgi:hypothetical protein
LRVGELKRLMTSPPKPERARIAQGCGGRSVGLSPVGSSRAPTVA